MKPGSVILIRLPQIGDRPAKLRPALVLATLPGSYQNVLLCGISSQLQLLEQNWDEVIKPGDPDYAESGLRRPSAVRLSYLYAVDPGQIVGAIGRVDRLSPGSAENPASRSFASGEWRSMTADGFRAADWEVRVDTHARPAEQVINTTSRMLRFDRDGP